jgi:hypothetical protein
MMNKLISYFITLALLLPTLTPAITRAGVSEVNSPKEFLPARDCPNGQCVEALSALLEAKVNQAKKDGCFPPASTKDATSWYQSKQLSLDCFRELKEIDELFEKLKAIELYLSEMTEKGQCESCGPDIVGMSGLISNIEEVDAATQVCSIERKKEISDKCTDDAKCVLISSATTALGPALMPFSQTFLPSDLREKGCKANQDSCLTQLATGFVKAVFLLFEGLWDILKGAGKLAKQGIKNLWNWVTEAENKSSTSQLAAAKASEDEGVFKQLMTDFSGTMGNLWSGLMAAIKEWLSSSIFCQEWSGTPQFSECKRPAQGLDCTECKAMITGMCAMTGTIVAEVIPAFLTGGLLTCAKYGAQGASKVAKLIKVSASTNKAIKNSKVADLALKPMGAISKSIKGSQLTAVVSKELKLALKALKNVLVKPSIKVAKSALEAMKSAAKSSKTFIMVSPAGPVVIFGTKTLKTAGKVLIFPFENALTIKSFHLGRKSFDKVFEKMGVSVVNSSRPLLTAEASRAMSAMDDAYKEYRLAKINGNNSRILEAEEKYLQVVRSNRASTVDEYLRSSKNMKFEEVIDELYPELHYGRFGKNISAEKIVKAEEELFEAISRMPESGNKEMLLKSYQEHLSSRLRKVSLPGQAFSKEEIIHHASLLPDEKVNKIQELSGKNFTESQRQSLVKALSETEQSKGSLFSYTAEELNQQRRLLTDAGLSKRQADEVIKSGLAGKLKPEDTFEALRKVALPKSEGLVEELSKNAEYNKILISFAENRKPAVARALKVFENGGMSSAEASAAFRKFDKNFTHVQNLAGSESDAASFLAEFIQRQKKAGLSDNVIRSKIDDAFGACK